MMHAKIPAPSKHVESGGENASRRLAPSADTASPNFVAEGSDAMARQRLQKITSNSARVKQIGIMQRMPGREGEGAKNPQINAGQGPATRIQSPASTQFSGTYGGNGLPQNLKSGIESLSGISMAEVRVHYNSPQPEKVQARAFAKGTDIHLGPGQEQHLPHEAWHVVQQAQGRVAATMQMAGAAVNNDIALEREADVMGARALAMPMSQATGNGYMGASMAVMDLTPIVVSIGQNSTLQRMTGMEFELDIPFYGSEHKVSTLDEVFFTDNAKKLSPNERQNIVNFLYGGLPSRESYGKIDHKYTITADHSKWKERHLALRHYINGRYLATGMDTHESMSNIEYITTPLQEGDPSSSARMMNIAQEIQAHAEESAKRATSNSSTLLPSPVATYWTGIPVAELKKLMKNDTTGSELLTYMTTQLNPSIYYQTTSGVFPSQIPELFNEAADEIKLGFDTISPGCQKDAQIVMALLQGALASAKTALKGSALLTQFNSDEQKSLLGWISLISQYVMASNLETTDYFYYEKDFALVQKTVEKNLLPYLPKTAASYLLNALPRKLWPAEDDENWRKLAVSLAKCCRQESDRVIANLGLTDFSKEAYYNVRSKAAIELFDKSEEKVHGPTSPEEWLVNLFSGNVAGTVNSGKSMAVDPGAIPGVDSLVIEGEHGIILEDRVTEHKRRFTINKRPAGIANVAMAAWERAERMRAKAVKPASVPAEEKKARPTLAAAPLPSDEKSVMRESRSCFGLLIDLLRHPKWRDQGWRLVGNRTPEGVLEIANVLKERPIDERRLRQIVPAILARKSAGRTRATNHFYDLVSRIIDKPDIANVEVKAQCDIIRNLLDGLPLSPNDGSTLLPK